MKVIVSLLQYSLSFSHLAALCLTLGLRDEGGRTVRGVHLAGDGLRSSRRRRCDPSQLPIGASLFALHVSVYARDREIGDLNGLDAIHYWL